MFLHSVCTLVALLEKVKKRTGASNKTETGLGDVLHAKTELLDECRSELPFSLTRTQYTGRAVFRAFLPLLLGVIPTQWPQAEI